MKHEMLCQGRSYNGIGGQVQIGTFLYRKYKHGVKESNDFSSC